MKGNPGRAKYMESFSFLAFQEKDGKHWPTFRYPTHILILAHLSVVTLLVPAAALCPEDQGGSRVQPWR